MISETRTTEMVTIPRAEYDSLRELQSAYDELKAQYEWLAEQLRLVKKRQFGSKSEKADDAVMEQYSLLFNEAEMLADKTEEPSVEVKAHKRKKSGNVKDILPEDIPVEVVEHRLPEEELICPQCGETMEVIGTEVVEQLQFIPAQAKLIRNVYYNYACKRCDREAESTPMIKTPKEPTIIPGSYASPEAVAHIAVQKFVMCAPLYRQEMEWNSRGIMLSRQTMSNWLVRCAQDWFSPIYDALRRELVLHDLLHADETELQVLHEEGKAAQAKSYMWLYRTSGDAERPIVLYDYEPGRGQEYPRAFLDGFHGYLQTDGYSGYNGLEGVIRIGCWAHARRKFEEARVAVPKGKQSPTAEQGVAYCSQLFKLEEKFKGLTPEERKQQRLERAKPVLDAMWSWAESRNAAPKSALGKALTYLKNQWTDLNNYLLDGRIELSNNRAERSIKPFVMSRKNFLFANTASGARSSAMILSLLLTASENGMDPYQYLRWVLKQAPTLKAGGEESWPMLLAPWNAPEECRKYRN